MSSTKYGWPLALNRKSAATLLLFSLVLCLLASSFLVGEVTSSGAHVDDVGTHYDDARNNSSLSCNHSPELSDQNVSLVNLWADRVVKIGDFGLVTVNDTVMIHNNGTATAHFWTFYLPSDVYPNLNYLAAYNVTSENTTKTLEVAGAAAFQSLVGMRITFGNVDLPANSSLKVRMIQQYTGIARPVKSQGTIAVYFYRYIVSPYVTMDHNTTVRISDVGTPMDKLFYAGKTVNPFNCSRLGTAQDGGWAYTLPTPVMEVTSIDRRIELGFEDYFTTTETHIVKNLGPMNLTSTTSAFRITLPVSYINGTLQTYDSAGNLSRIISGRDVSVYLRLTLGVNWTYTYYVSYKTSIDDYKTTENGLDVLTMNSTTVSNCSVDLEKVVVVFPSHTLLSSLSDYADDVQIVDDKPVVSFTFDNIVPLNNRTISFKYSLDIAHSLERPMLFTFGFFFIGLIYVIARKLVPGAKPTTVVREEETARELKGLIKEFSSNYEEKTALTLESEQLGEDRRKGRISKRAYVERMNVAKRRIASLTNLINEEKGKLSTASRRYATLIKQLDTYEEERENAKAALENLEFRRRQGKVAGEVYNRLKYENTKKIDKATSGIDTLIMQFRQETL
jgi:hypothetical protein